MPVRKRPTALVDMAKLMSFQGAEPLVLHQMSGPGRLRKIRLLPLEEAVFGRDDDCQVILDEDPVSRRHARVLFADLKPQVLDLGSTNGTFLNGKQVHRALLKDGDQIQIGGSVFRVAIGKEGREHEPLSEASVKHVQSLIQKSKGQSSTHPGQSSAISGNLSEIRLPSLLQVLESDRATGTLVIRHAGREGASVRAGGLERTLTARCD
jgi:pSer/pThr/pTyr-binding forkhead associated (FHA) protein